MEDYPSKDGYYLVAFEGSDGKFNLLDTEVWEFDGSWYSIDGDREDFPSFYIDLVLPRID